MISLAEAELRFVELIQNLSVRDQEEFFTFITQEWKPANFEKDRKFVNDSDDSCDKRNVLDDPEFTLSSIAGDIKNMLPFSAILPSESITTPKVGENFDCDPKTTLHIDEFLYDEDDLDNLIQTGDVKKHYCLDCGSKNIADLIFISHSTSRDTLYHIFNDLLPTLENKTILDVGSRLGAVLYGAYVYTDASKIIGAEMNEDFCKMQQDIVKKYRMNDRIEVLNKRIEDVPDVVSNSDVIIMNNVFEFYLSESDQINVWRYLKETIKAGTILVTRPKMEIILSKLPTGISVKDWLEPFDMMVTKSDNFSTLLNTMNVQNEKNVEIACYKVLEK